jgi:hypothetical protein
MKLIPRFSRADSGVFWRGKCKARDADVYVVVHEVECNAAISRENKNDMLL